MKTDELLDESGKNDNVMFWNDVTETWRRKIDTVFFKVGVKSNLNHIILQHIHIYKILGFSHLSEFLDSLTQISGHMATFS